MASADAVYTIYKNKEREEFLVYPESKLINQTMALYSMISSGLMVGSELNGICQFNIGISRDVSYGGEFDSVVRDECKNVTVINDEESKFRLLLSGRIDMIASNQRSASYFINKFGKHDEVRMHAPVLHTGARYLAFSNKSPHVDLVDAFDKAIRNADR